MELSLITLWFTVDLTGQKNMLNWQLIAELQKMLKHKDIEVKLVSLMHRHDMSSFPVHFLFESVVCDVEFVTYHPWAMMTSLGQ